MTSVSSSYNSGACGSDLSFPTNPNELEQYVTRLPNGDIQQNHCIKGLKVYSLPGSDKLVADIAGKNIAQGPLNKEIKRLGDNRSYVRLGLRKRLKGEKSWEDRFYRKMTKEMDVRQRLQGIPHISTITKVHYINQRGKPKTRYLMEQYDGDVSNLIGSPLTEAAKRKVLHGCLDALDSLSEMHRLGLVHGDVKLFNILYKGTRWDWCDFELTRERGEKIPPHEGCMGYMAPEIFCDKSPVADPSQDMFAFGTSLLNLMDGSLSFENYYHQACTLPDGRERADAFRKLLEDFQNELVRKGDQLSLLIRDLINFNPMMRPTCEQTLTRLKNYVDTQK